MQPSIIVNYGSAGLGKTTFAASVPGAKTLFEFDIGSWERASAVLPQEQVDEVKFLQYEPPLGLSPTPSKNGASKPPGFKALWYRWLEDYLDFLRGDTPTGIIDTATLLWTCCHRGYLEELGDNRSNLQAIEYGEPNARMEGVMAGAKQYRKNLILLHHETDIYATQFIDGQLKEAPTGEKRHAGYGNTPQRADIVLRTTLEKGKPVGTLQKAGTGGLELKEMVIVEPSYSKLADLIDAATLLKQKGMPVVGSFEDIVAAREMVVNL